MNARRPDGTGPLTWRLALALLASILTVGCAAPASWMSPGQEGGDQVQP